MDAQPPLPLPLLLTVLLVGAGCQQPGGGPPTPPPPSPAPRVGPPPPASFAVRSPAARDGDLLPRDFGCDGRNVSPPVTWDALPPRTRSLALIVSAPDEPATLWTLWGVPASARELPEGLKPTGGMREGTTSKGTPGWVGPCPPAGPPSRYELRLYALASELDLPGGASVLGLHAAMYGHVLAESVLTVRYARAPR